MTADAAFAPLLADLDRRAVAGLPVPFWLRDDDAVAPGAGLDQLLALTGQARVPVLLAVIPAPTGAALADRLTTADLAAVAVHGWAHADHAAGRGKAQELGLHRPAAQVLDELGRGLAHLTALHPGRALPLLVPPWNRIDAGLLPHLPALGYRALSVFGPERPGPLAVINAHVDLIDWRGTRGAWPAEVLVAAMVARLQALPPGGTVGLLSHHLVHDAGAWAFLERLFTLTAAHPGCRWIGGGDLLTAALAAQ